ncbi:MAG: HD domain-containing protein [Desulfobacterales bacterium]|nr:HD domain-containing protein [Desulfobacterales bacterium]
MSIPEDFIEKAFKNLTKGKAIRISRLLDTLLTRLYDKDPYSNHHSQAVSKYSWFLAKRHKLKAHRIQLLVLASRYHDVGKTVFTDEMFSYEEPLTDDQWAIVRKHPETGFSEIFYLIESEFNSERLLWLSLILFHHRDYDGTGYPTSLLTDESKDYINRYNSRIQEALSPNVDGVQDENDLRLQLSVLHIADAISAATSSMRSNKLKKRKSMSWIIQDIEGKSGKKYHPEVVSTVNQMGVSLWERFARDNALI